MTGIVVRAEAGLSHPLCLVPATPLLQWRQPGRWPRSAGDWERQGGDDSRGGCCRLAVAPGSLLFSHMLTTPLVNVFLHPCSPGKLGWTSWALGSLVMGSSVFGGMAVRPVGCGGVLGAGASPPCSGSPPHCPPCISRLSPSFQAHSNALPTGPGLTGERRCLPGPAPALCRSLGTGTFSRVCIFSPQLDCELPESRRLCRSFLQPRSCPTEGLAHRSSWYWWEGCPLCSPGAWRGRALAEWNSGAQAAGLDFSFGPKLGGLQTFSSAHMPNGHSPHSQLGSP